MSPGKKLKQHLLAKELLVTPGAYDALNAKLIEEAGFKAVYVTGAGIANSQFCFSDVGLTTQTEVLSQVRRIVDAVEIPVVADIDTGFGGVINVVRTVREFEKAGVAGLQIEDQQFPKKCGHFDGKEVIPRDEMISKINAVLDTRIDPDLVIIARTDARNVLGLDRAIKRGQAYIEAGADAIFVEAPCSKKELRKIAKQRTAPKVVNMVEGGKTPLCNSKELEDMGYNMVIYANAALRTSIKAVQSMLKSLKEEGSTSKQLDRMITMEERNRITNLKMTYRMEERYSIGR